MKSKWLGFISLLLILCLMTGCVHAVDTEIFGPRAINDFIDLKNEEPEDITELICDPGESAAISSSHYDKLGKLENLESLTLVGIGDEKDAQTFFEELKKLDKLKSLTLKSSRIGSVSKLKDIDKRIEAL